MKQFIILLIIVFSASQASADPGVIRVSGHSDYPPFMWQEGEGIVGVSAELSASVFRALQIEYAIRAVGPWKRVQEYAKRGKIDVIMGLYKTPERFQYIDFTLPYSDVPTSVFVKKGHSFLFQNWNDLIGKKGTTLQGESFGGRMDTFIANKLNVVRTFSMEASFIRLIEQRSHYLICGYYPCMIYARRSGYWDEVEILPNHVIAEQLRMGFSKNSRFKSRLPDVNREIKRLKQNGQIQSWIRQYSKIYLEKSNPGDQEP